MELPYNLASSLPHLVMQRLSKVVADEIGQLWKVDDKLRELQTTYMEIEATLAKLDCWQISNPTLELWLQDLERYCYDTEDLVDDLILRRSSKEEDEKPSQKPVRSQIFKSGRFTIPHKIGELQKKLHVIGGQIQSLLSAGAINSSQQPQVRVSSVHCCGKSLLFDKTPLASGTSRDQDKRSIVGQLINLQSESCGVSIIGMDGLGKTVLVRTIIADDKIGIHFPLVLSTSVSGHFKIEDIVNKLVTDHSRRRLDFCHQTVEFDQNDAILQDLLRRHRSLIILDDLWGVTDEDWDYFRHNYLDLCPGARIIITTRNPKVAEVTESTSFYLNRMTDEDCKRLIVHRGKLSQFECERWASDIEFIAKKCKGMPIVANKLGLKLSKKKDDELKATIVQFKMKELWDLQEFREVFPSLNLNEPKLPPDHKRCFTYCSLFTPSYEFKRDDLIQFWEVEGFIQRQQTSTSKQAMEECFDKLLSRSILQPFKSKNSKQPVYNMHEFNHEFAHLLASKAFRRVGEGNLNLLTSCESIRHLSFTRESIDEPLLKKIEQCKGLRTFLLLHQDKPKKRTISYNFFQNLHRLRLLDLSHTNISNLPKPFSPSKHLRYLDLSYTEVKKLPEPIRCLRALQILKLENCSSLLQLPKDLNQLISLTHLYVNMKALICVPSNMGKLTKLEVLNSFDVGKDKGCKVAELRNMKDLTKIHISSLENIQDRKEAQEAMLSEKLLLRTLVLEWDSSPRVDAAIAEEVLEGLQPHDYLHDLVVRNYAGKFFSIWMISASCQLVSIHLDNCRNCEVLPSLGHLPILKSLVLRTIHNVRNFNNHFRGQSERLFPCLELLEFRDMEGFASWTGLEAGDLPHLHVLKIIACPSLVNLPSFEHLSCLTNLEINNCPELLSLPLLPSSMNGESGELIIIDSDLASERCQTRGADWKKIIDIPFVEIDAIRVLTRLSSEPPVKDKDEVSMDKQQPPTVTIPGKGKNVAQVPLDEVSRVQYCSVRLRLSDEIYTSQDNGATSEDQNVSSHVQPATNNKMVSENHSLQDDVQRNKGPSPAPSASKSLQIEDCPAVSDSPFEMAGIESGSEQKSRTSEIKNDGHPDSIPEAPKARQSKTRLTRRPAEKTLGEQDRRLGERRDKGERRPPWRGRAVTERGRAASTPGAGALQADAGASASIPAVLRWRRRLDGRAVA